MLKFTLVCVIAVLWPLVSMGGIRTKFINLISCENVKSNLSINLVAETDEAVSAIYRIKGMVGYDGNVIHIDIPVWVYGRLESGSYRFEGLNGTVFEIDSENEVTLSATLPSRAMDFDQCHFLSSVMENLLLL